MLTVWGKWHKLQLDKSMVGIFPFPWVVEKGAAAAGWVAEKFIDLPGSGLVCNVRQAESNHPPYRWHTMESHSINRGTNGQEPANGRPRSRSPSEESQPLCRQEAGNVRGRCRKGCGKVVPGSSPGCEVAEVPVLEVSHPQCPPAVSCQPPQGSLLPCPSCALFWGHLTLFSLWWRNTCQRNFSRCGRAYTEG